MSSERRQSRQTVVAILAALAGAAATGGALYAWTLHLAKRAINPAVATLPAPPPPPKREPLTFRKLGSARGPGVRTMPLPEARVAGEETAFTRRTSRHYPNTLSGEGGLVFVMVKEQDAVVALDLATGARVWRLEVQTYDGMSVCAGLLFLRGWGTIYAIDARTGQKLWRHAERNVASTRLSAGFPQPRRVFNAPVCDGERVYTTTASPLGTKHDQEPGSVIALHAQTGKVLWMRKLSGRWRMDLNNTRALLGISPGRLILAGEHGDHFATALNPQDGSVLWHTPDTTTWRSQITLLPRLAIFTAGSSVQALDPETGLTLWSAPKVRAAHPAARGRGDHRSALLVQHKGTLSALDARTGARRWSQKLPGSRDQAGAPQVSGEHVYVTSARGLHRLSLADGSSTTSAQTLPDARDALPVGELVLVVSGDELVALDAATFTRRWSFSPVRASTRPVAATAMSRTP